MGFISKIKEIYTYRHMLFTLVKQDINGRYKGSIFGFLWTLLNPLFMLLVYSIVFQFVAGYLIDFYSYDIFYLILCLLSIVGMVICIFYRIPSGNHQHLFD